MADFNTWGVTCYQALKDKYFNKERKTYVLYKEYGNTFVTKLTQEMLVYPQYKVEYITELKTLPFISLSSLDMQYLGITKLRVNNSIFYNLAEPYLMSRDFYNLLSEQHKLIFWNNLTFHYIMVLLCNWYDVTAGIKIGSYYKEDVSLMLQVANEIMYKLKTYQKCATFTSIENIMVQTACDIIGLPSKALRDNFIANNIAKYLGVNYSKVKLPYSRVDYPEFRAIEENAILLYGNTQRTNVVLHPGVKKGYTVFYEYALDICTAIALGIFPDLNFNNVNECVWLCQLKQRLDKLPVDKLHMFVMLYFCTQYEPLSIQLKM